jgi:hypothetical protein
MSFLAKGKAHQYDRRASRRPQGTLKRRDLDGQGRFGKFPEGA